MGGIASLFGVAISLAVGGLLCLGIGGGALAWMRRNGLDRDPAPERRRRRRADARALDGDRVRGHRGGFADTIRPR